MKHLALTLFLLGCVPLPGPDVPRPDGTDCTSICTHYSSMQCVEAQPTPEGHTCVEICVNMRSAELPDTETYYQCVAKSNSCEDALKC
jgi:hypothetical protein